MPFPSIRSLAFAVAAAVSVATPVVAQNSLSGSYLAGRHASVFGDFEAAAQYYTRALALDPSNTALMENAMMSYIGLGKLNQAVPLARRIIDLNVQNQTAQMVLIADQLKRGAFDSVVADIEAGASVSPLVNGMIGAWAKFGQGQVTEALEGFDDTGIETGLTTFTNYHKALALASVGDFEGADALFSNEEEPLYSAHRVVLAHVQILSQLERNADAIAIIHDIFGSVLDPALLDLLARLEAGETLPFDTIRDARDGAAEVFFTVAGALNGEAATGYTLVYSRLTEYLRPEHVDAILMSASLMESQEQYELATKIYAQVPADSPAFYEAELGRASALERQDKIDTAIEVLRQLSKTHGTIPIVHVNLGDMYRRNEAYDDASKAYDRALELFETVEPQQWFIFYSRAITHEREDRWELAEADFRKALELRPDQPQVLNYLGYSFVEMGINYDEALDMIERAVAARPDDGYITDSLGWVMYRLGRYEEAVTHMERAAELEPIDPIVNDHLGDVLWAVGRKVEAAFQWRRALSFIDPDDVPKELSPDRIRRKLEVGLDEVLAEEGKPPLTIANGD